MRTSPSTTIPLKFWGMLRFCSECRKDESNPTASVCAGCLGILDEKFILAIVETLTQKIQSKYVGTRSVTFSLSVPVSLRIQEILLKSVTNNYPTYIKDSFKKRLLFAWNAHSTLQILPSQDADVCLMVTVAFSAEFESQILELFMHKILELPVERKGKRKKACSNSSLDEVLASESVETRLQERKLEIEKHFNDFPAATPTFQVDCKSKSVYVAGFYNKWERGISQTPWIIDGTLKTELSVSSLLEFTLQGIFGFSGTKFCSAGREDADVRMLGKGRPFLLELVDAKNLEKVHHYESNPGQLQQDFQLLHKNSHLVSASDLCVVPGHLGISKLKEGEEEKEKVYRCLVWTERPVTAALLSERIDGAASISISQITPIRVLQRRALMTRQRQIYQMKSQLIDSHYFVLHLKSEAGTYIKEFVHGDFERTQPSLRTLLWPSEDYCTSACDILELDVLSVDLPNWPPHE